MYAGKYYTAVSMHIHTYVHICIIHTYKEFLSVISSLACVQELSWLELGIKPNSGYNITRVAVKQVLWIILNFDLNKIGKTITISDVR